MVYTLPVFQSVELHFFLTPTNFDFLQCGMYRGRFPSAASFCANVPGVAPPTPPADTQGTCWGGGSTIYHAFAVDHCHNLRVELEVGWKEQYISNPCYQFELHAFHCCFGAIPKGRSASPHFDSEECLHAMHDDCRYTYC